MLRQMRRGWLMLVFAAGCSFTFDSEAPDLPLLGAPVDTDPLPRLNDKVTTGGVSIVTGADNKPWAVFSEPIDTDNGPQKGLRLVRLAGDPVVETIVSDGPSGNGPAFYFTPPSMMPSKKPDPSMMTELHIHFVGSGQPDDVFQLPGGQPLLIPDAKNTVFVWWVLDMSTTQFLVQRRDRTFSRMIPIGNLPPTDPFSAGELFFSRDGKWLYIQDSQQSVQRFSTLSDDSEQIGMMLPKLLALDENRQVLVGCSADSGLSLTPVAPLATTTVIDPEPCYENGILWLYGTTTIYQSNDTHAVKRIPSDGSGPPVEVLGGDKRFLGFGPSDAVLFSDDPIDRYVNGAGDAWMGDWKFMTRGRNIQFSRDNSKVRWLDFAAQPSAVGDLLSAPLGGSPVRLGRNVRRYEELNDGRVIASADRAFRGTQNRVVVIDEQAGAAYWVADQAADYVRIPGSTDVLVDVISGPSGFDIVRVPVPPQQ
jgi:hypothetical protein